MTALIGDIATIFGCLIGLKPEVTAITFVALGTSLPDLFASKNAAQNEEYADASIGNVTGSNGVNVFLGLGIPWVIASIYWEVKVCFFGLLLWIVTQNYLGRIFYECMNAHGNGSASIVEVTQLRTICHVLNLFFIALIF